MTPNSRGTFEGEIECRSAGGSPVQWDELDE
jgi:hypothetical protein